MITTALVDTREPSLDPYDIAGDPNGLAFDTHADTLYAADARSGTIWSLDGIRQTRVARIDSAGLVSAQRIGGVAITPYGTLYVSRLGHGRAGAVFRVEPDGSYEPIEGIDPRFWRIGLCYDAVDHVLYSTQYLKGRSGPFEGSIAALDVASGVLSTVVGGFAKPVGVTRVADTLVVTDAARAVVIRVDLFGRAVAKTVIADQLGRPDSVCSFDRESVLVTAYDREAQIGSVHRVWLDGTSRLIASGSWEPRGVAHDRTRVFVATRRTGAILVIPLA